MKKSFVLTPFKIIWSVVLLFLLNLPQRAAAQGFFNVSNHAALSSECRVEILPDGYLLKPTFYHPIADVVYYFGSLKLDAEGHEIEWDSIERGTALSGPNYKLLDDDNLLEYGSNFGGPNWKVRKIKHDDTPIWSLLFTPTLEQQVIVAVGQNSFGEAFLMGYEKNTLPSGGANKAVLRKTDQAGNLLWTINEPLPDSISLAVQLAAMTQDGGCLFFVYNYGPGVTNTQTLYKASASGQLEWTKIISCSNILENSQGEIYAYGTEFDTNAGLDSTVLRKLSSTGNLLWEKIVDDTNGGNSGLFLGTNGDVLVCYKKVINGQVNESTNHFARYSPEGVKRWDRHYSLLSDEFGGDLVSGGAATPDGGFLLVGWWNAQLTLAVLKIDANGNLYPGYITGKLALDDNVNCLNDSTELALQNLKVQLLGPNHSLYATTDQSGHYEITDVPGDDYLLSAGVPSTLWESCVGMVQVAVPDTGSITVVQDFPIQVLEECPFMTVDIATPILRRCMTNYYTVNYCNQGSTVADSAYLLIILDQHLIFNSAGIPHTQNGDTLSFALGAVPSLTCGAFTFTVTVDCDSTVLGETICVSASIFPDTICNPPSNWSGALLAGSGECIGDSVRFLLHNIGTGPSTGGLNSYVVDEHVIMFQQPIPSLAPNETFQIMVEANGNTKRFVADQEPNAPGLEKPSVGVEGCGPNGTTNWGFIIQYPNKDGNPFTDTDCHQVVGAYDPNDKQAFPTGVKSAHLIEANTPLEYQIRFQNTGTDTAFTVVVKDTLSYWLDPATVRPGAASHPYTWSLSGEGILTFTFEHILLPDSNINEAASHGFIQFNIEQQKDLLPGVVLENRAGIYFDFNEAVMTNTVFHTIGQGFLASDTKAPLPKQNLLEIWPNPAGDEVNIRLANDYKPGQRLVLRNALGKVLREVPVLGQTTELLRTGIPAGLYFVEILDGKRTLAIGKIIWQ